MSLRETSMAALARLTPVVDGGAAGYPVAGQADHAPDEDRVRPTERDHVPAADALSLSTSTVLPAGTVFAIDVEELVRPRAASRIQASCGSSVPERAHVSFIDR